MMETIRTAANHVVVKIIFAIIIVSFIFTGIGFLGFGGGNSSRDQQEYIAKVNGEGISRAEFENQARRVTANANGDSSFIKQLRRNVLYYQIDNYLAYKFAEDLNTNISNDQVKDNIRKQVDFFENGQFNNDKYLKILELNDFTPDAYAEILRKVLQQQQVLNAVVMTDFVLPIDSEISSLQKQTRSIYADLINTSAVNMDDVNITTEDEQKYYEEHQKEFFRKERAKVKYIVNTKEDLLKTIKVTDNEIKQEYETNNKTYRYPTKKSFSVIYVTNKEEADDINKELLSGVDFDSVVNKVNQNSEISPYGKNGSLGWFTDDDSLPQAFKEANLDNIGQISTPIATDNGYVIVKLENIQKSTPMDFDYAKSVIGSKLRKQKLQQAFLNIENKMKEGLEEPSVSIEDLANKTGLKIFNTNWISYNNQLSITAYPEVRDVIFSDEMIVDDKATNKISELIHVGKDLDEYDFIIQVVDYRPEGIAPFEEVRDIINKKLYISIANSRFKSTIDNILDELKESGTSSNVQFTKNYTLTRDSKDLDKQIVDMVFDLQPSTTGKGVFGAKSLNDKEAYIVALTGVNTPKEYQDISAELRPLLIDNTHFYFAADIRSKAKIEFMPNSNL
ncbi:SurA N-terminal domain-containing protein [Gilliamella sp. wkB112]|uniref:SurA N-terminal domain-containing protein n=1 Tax=Gilliamella sp. wkB112 TaxID=3120257 RepID=UPI0008287F4D|nr:SurA N-terminal domain-containing protein [Gilliamella apicola]OCG04712.1 hypothetical protein A9G12_06805 [Gilliamella apicola]